MGRATWDALHDDWDVLLGDALHFDVHSSYRVDVERDGTRVHNMCEGATESSHKYSSRLVRATQRQQIRAPGAKERVSMTTDDGA